MKKLLYTVLAALLLFTSCSKKSELTPVNIKPIVYQTDNITVKVEPKLELLMIALRLAEVEPYSNDAYTQDYSQFVDGVDKLFEKQKEHPIVKELKSHCKNYKDGTSEILKITRYISDDMTQLTIKPKELPEEMMVFWKGINLKNFVAQFNDFAVKGNFERIWILYEAKLKNQAINVQDYYDFNKKVTDWISDFYFSKDNIPLYEIHSTTLSGNEYILPSPIYKDDKTVLEIICPSYWTRDYNWNATYSALFISSGYTYHLIRKHWDLFSEEGKRIVTSIYTQNQITEKITDLSVKTHIATCISLGCLFNFEDIQNDEEFKTALFNTLTTYYLIPNPEKLVSIIEHYYDNRDTYPDFESFVVNYLPEALKEF